MTPPYLHMEVKGHHHTCGGQKTRGVTQHHMAHFSTLEGYPLPMSTACVYQLSPPVGTSGWHTVTGIHVFPPQHVKFTISVDTATAPKEPVVVDGLKVPPAVMSFPEFNDTSSQEFLEHVAMTIQNANKSINYWVTER